MSTIMSATSASARAKPTVIALHCSGASGRQWRHLSAALGGGFELIAPDLYGCGSRGPWSGERPFNLKEEAALIVDIIDSCSTPVHLVGHSYGGGVALRAAIERPTRIASLSLYEPTAFHMLRAMGPDGRLLLDEIRAIARAIDRAVLTGNYREAARRFVDYWNGDGAWAALRRENQAEILRYIPKACLDFRALIEEPTPLYAYQRIRSSLLLMRGETSPEPALAIVRKLTAFMKPAGAVTVSGAGHMGPFSHAELVAKEMAAHIVAAEPQPVSLPGVSMGTGLAA